MPEMIPVANTIQPPNIGQGISNLSSLIGLQQQRLGIQQQQQQLQTGQYIQQQQQAGAQQQQQMMAEREQLQSQIQSGAFGDPNSDDFATKLAGWAPGNLPLIGPGVAQAALKTQSDKVSLRSSVADLQQKYRTGLGSIVSGFYGQDVSAQKVKDAIDEYIRQNPDAMQAGHWAQNLIQHIDNVPDPAKKQHMLESAVGELTGKAQVAPGTIETPTQVQPGLVHAAGGFAPSGEAVTKQVQITLPNGQVAILDPTSKHYQIVSGGGGGGGGTLPGAGAKIEGLTADNDPMAPNPNDPDWKKTVYGQSVQQAIATVQGAQTQDANYQTNMNTADMVRELSNKVGPHTGPGTSAWVTMTGGVGSRIGKENVADLQTLGSFLDLQAARLRDSMGLPPTNMGLATAHSMGTDLESQKGAIQAKTDYYQALTELNHRYRTGLDKAGNLGVNSSPSAVGRFKSVFTANADPIAMEADLALKRGDKAAFNRIMSALSPEQRIAVAQHGRNLDALTSGQYPK